MRDVQSPRVLDFARAWHQQRAMDPLFVVLDGFDLRRGLVVRTWRRLRRHPARGLRVEIPGSMPAGLRLHMHNTRLSADDHELTLSELEVAARFVFGERTARRLLRARITEQQLAEALMLVLEVYSNAEAERAASGAAPA